MRQHKSVRTRHKLKQERQVWTFALVLLEGGFVSSFQPDLQWRTNFGKLDSVRTRRNRALDNEMHVLFCSTMHEYSSCTRDSWVLFRRFCAARNWIPSLFSHSVLEKGAIWRRVGFFYRMTFCPSGCSRVEPWEPCKVHTAWIWVFSSHQSLVLRGSLNIYGNWGRGNCRDDVKKHG